MSSKYRRSSLSALVSNWFQPMRSSNVADYAEIHGIIRECVCFAFIWKQKEKWLIGCRENLCVRIWQSKEWPWAKTMTMRIPFCQVCDEVKHKQGRPKDTLRSRSRSRVATELSNSRWEGEWSGINRFIFKYFIVDFVTWLCIFFWSI